MNLKLVSWCERICHLLIAFWKCSNIQRKSSYFLLFHTVLYNLKSWKSDNSHCRVRRRRRRYYHCCCTQHCCEALALIRLVCVTEMIQTNKITAQCFSVVFIVDDIFWNGKWMLFHTLPPHNICEKYHIALASLLDIGVCVCRGSLVRMMANKTNKQKYKHFECIHGTEHSIEFCTIAKIQRTRSKNRVI